MDPEQEFEIKDCVAWYSPYSSENEEENICYGEITDIFGEGKDKDHMTILVHKKEGECTVSTGAVKINGQWLVHRAYEGYKEPLYKIYFPLNKFPREEFK